MQDNPLVNLSGTPQYPQPGGAIDTSPKNQEEYSPLLNGSGVLSLSKTGNIPASDISMAEAAPYKTGRFPTVMYGYNNENAYAQDQSFGGRMISGVGKGLSLAGTTFLQTTVGAANGIAEWAHTGKFSSFYDNEFNRSLDEWNKKLEDKLPNYYTEQEKNAAWYSSKYWFTGNFLWDSVIKNLGFSVGAAGSGLAFSAALKGLSVLPGLSRLVSIGKQAEIVGATESKLAGVAKVTETLGNMEKLNEQFLGAYNVLSPGGRAVVAGLSTSGEAGFEALNNGNQYRETKIQEYREKYHEDPKGDDLEKINSEAEAVGKYSYLANVALLSATNYIQFPKILGSSYRAEKGIANGITREIGEISKETGKWATKPVKSRLLQTIKNVAPYTFSASEGFEEGSQYVIQTGTQDYYNKKNKGEDPDILSSLIEGIKQTVTTDEGMKNILIGGLSGSLMLGYGRYIERSQKSKDTQTAINAFNKYELSYFTKDTEESVKRGTVLQEDHLQAIEKADILEAKDTQRDYAINYLTPRIKYGRFDLVKADIEDYKKLAATKEGWTQLVAEGKALETDTKESFLKRIDGLEKLAEKMKTSYQAINLRFGGIMTKSKDGKSIPLYDSKTIDKMVYATMKIADYDDRIPSLLAKLSVPELLAANIDVNQIMQDLHEGKHESFNKATAIVKGMNDINKDEYGEALDDIAELSLRRRKFLTEYEDMKTNPQKWNEKEELPVVENPVNQTEPTKKVTIKTKYGERQVETNTEYILGKTTEKDEHGNDVFGAPIIKIIGENEDGTIKIHYKTAAGKWASSDISHNKLEAYSLVKPSELQKNKKASFVYEHWNTIFKHWGIKDINGNPVTGRIEYNQTKHQILFRYTDSKGKVRTREIIGKNVVFDKSKYNHPMLEAVGELKASQKASQQELGDENSSLSDKLTLRNNVISSLYDNGVARIEKITKALESNKEKITKLEDTLKEETEKLEKLEGKKRVKKKIRAIEVTIKDITKLHQDIEAENIELQNEKEELEYNLPIFKEMIDSIDNTATESTEILEQLKKDVDNSQNLIDAISEQIKTNKSLINQIEKVLSDCLSVLKDYINKLKENNPGIPLSIDEFQDNLEKYLGEEGAKQLIANRQGFTEQVLSLEADINAFEDELHIPALSKQVDTLNKEISKLSAQLDDAVKIQKVKAQVYDNFKEFIDRLAQEEAEEKAFEENAELKKQYIGTMDTSMQNTFSGVEYEPASKKSFWSVIRGTRPITLTDEQKKKGEVEKPHNVRANKFGFKFAKFNEDRQKAIRGVVVTQNTEDEVLPGLIDFLMKDLTPEQQRKYKKGEVIAMVVVQMNDDGSTYSLVDENGEVIPKTDENSNTVNPLEKAIFQTFPMGDLKGSYKQEDGTNKEDSMFRDDVSDKRRKSAEEQYKKWRTKILSQTALGNPEKIKVSFGSPEFSKTTDDKGNESKDTGAKVSVRQAGFVTDEELQRTQVVTVSTEDEVSEGEVTFNKSKGRVFLRIPGMGLVKLFNRKFSEKQANVIFDVIHQVCKNGVKKGEISTETDMLINWLKTVVYWGIAKDPNTNERKAAGYNNIWFETTKEDGKPVTRLYISGITKDSKKAFMFTPTGLQERKYEIVQLLQELYHNTFATRVNQDSWKSKYYEIIGIDENGNPITKEWANYQTYLLSDKGRPVDEIPLITQYRPLVDENDVNRKGIYFTLNSPTDDFNFEVEKKKAETPAKKEEAKKPEAKKKEEKKEEKKPTAYKPASFKLDGSEELMHFDAFGGFDITFNLNAKTFNEKGTIDGISIPNNVVEKIMMEKGMTAEQVHTLIAGSLITKLKDQLNLAAIPKEAPIADVPVTEEKKEVSPTAEPKPAIEEMDDDGIPADDDNRADMRLAPIEKAVIYEQEDWNKIEKFLMKNFPMISIYRVRNAIRGTNGRQIWGMLHKGAIYLHETAEVGTIYHEVFEAVWKMFAGPAEKQKVIDEFRSREGEYTDRFTGQKVKYSEATNSQIKEELAEEYRDLVLYGKQVAKPRGKNFISRLFQDIVNFFNEFFFGKKARTNTQTLFDKIGNGYYKKFNPYEAKLSFAKEGVIDIEDAFADESSELREKIPTQQTHEIIEHMTFALLRDLIKTNQSLFRVEKWKKSETYEKLKLEVLGKIKGKRNALLDRTAKGEQSAIDEVNALKQLYNNTKEEWDALVERHEQFLNTRGISFDENDELAIEDENKGKDEPYGDPRKVDSFRKSNAAIKLLLGSLAYSSPVKRMVDGKEQTSVEFIPSTIGGARLLAPDQVHIDLVNKLHKACDLDDMFAMLRKEAIANPNYEALYYRLTKQTLAEKTVDYDKFESHDWQLISAFWKSMKLQNPDALTVFILGDGQVIISDSSMNSAAKQAKKEMFYSMVDKIKTGTKFFTYNKNTGKYTATKTLKDMTFSGKDINSHILFLKELGISFDAEDLNNLKASQLRHFRDAVVGIHKSLSALGPVVNKAGFPVDEDGNVVNPITKLSDEAQKPQNDKSVFSLTSKTLDIEGRLTQLGVVKSIIERPEFESTYFNINGERTQTYIGGNAGSRLYDVISSLSNINELKGDVKDYKQFRYLLTDVFAKGSVILNRIFLMGEDQTGDRIDGTENILKTTVIDGLLDEEKGKKKESSKQSYKQRLTQEVNLNLEGVYLNLVPADASMEHATKMHEADSPFVTDDMFLTGNYLSIFKDYFISELNLARDKNRRVVKGKDKTHLRFFKSILGDTLHNKIISKENKSKSPTEVYDRYDSEIEEAVKNFILNEAKDTYGLLKTFDIIKEDVDGLTVENINFGDNMDITEKNIMTKLSVLSANYIIANIEIHKLLYSDPYQYENELKRIKNFLSPRQYLMHGSPRVNSALHKVYNNGYEEGDLGYTDMRRDHFRTVTLADINATADLDGYDPFEETDGAGLITIKGKRMLKLRAGAWTDDMERQYRHDIEFERIAKETEDENERDTLLTEHEKNNPGINELYTPEKPIVAGNKANGRDYNDAVLHKFALSVYSYRILYLLDKNSTALKLYDKMQKEDIDYVVYNSGVKIGAEKQFNVYNEDGSFNNEPFETPEQASHPNMEQGITKIPYSIMAIQSEVPTKDEAFVTQGSQMTKLVTMDFMDAGMPIDFEAKEKDFDKRYAKWILLKDKGSYNSGNNLYNEIKNNQKLLEARITAAYSSLLDRLGIEQTSEGFKIVDREKLSEALSNEIMRREVNDNIIKAFNEFKQKDVILEATPSYQQIRHILYSIADKTLVHPKITGGQKVQVPSRFLESIQGKAIKKKNAKGKDVITYESNILKFYKDEDGKRHCEIMIGRWFESDKSDEELMHYFNETEEGKREARALFGVAFRIPTQKQNSIDVFRIAKFLPKEYGDSVIIPSALVKKAGSDFDIDKLSIYLKNLFQDTDGKLKLVPYMGIGKEAKFKMGMFAGDFLNRKIKSLEQKLEKNEKMQSLFGDLSLGRVSEKGLNKWIPIMKEWFADQLVDDKLPVHVIEQFFMDRIEGLNKKIEHLTDDDINEMMINELTERWYKQSLENEYIESCEKLISHPLNFKNLTKPNSSKQLEDIEKEITELLGEEEIDYSNVGNMLSRKFMSSLRQAFVGGKQAIAISAISQTNNAMNQRSAMYNDTDRLYTPGMISLEDRAILGAEKESQIFATNPDINFKEHNTIIINGKRVSTLSKSEDAHINPEKRNLISDIIAQFIDGYVDIAKNGPWIMRMGASPTLAPTWLFLLKMGVPIKSVAYFMNQPIIKEYVRSIENKGYSWLFIEDFIIEELERYAPSKEHSITEIPSQDDLRKTVGKKNNTMSDIELAQQQYMLKEFLKYAKMASHLLQVTQGSNFDTAYLSDPLIAFKKLMQYEKAKKAIISSVDDLLDESFVRTLKDIIYNTRNALSEILISDKTNEDGISARDVLEATLAPYIQLNDKDFLKLAQKSVSDLFDWAMQTDKDAARKIAGVLVSKKDINDKQINSYAKQLIDFKDKILGNSAKDITGDVNHPLYNNFVLKALQLKPSNKEGRVDNLFLQGKTNKMYDQNMIIHGFEEIRDYLKEKGDDSLYRKLIAVTVMQSGLKRSVLSFTDLLPYEDFKDVYYESLFRLNELSHLSDFHTAHIFERNNFNEDDIIPFIKDKFTISKKENFRYPGKKIVYYKNQLFIGDALMAAKKKKQVPMIVSMDVTSRASSSDFIVYSWQNEISHKTRIKRRKNGDTSHIHKLLMKKVYFVDNEGNRKPLIHTSEWIGPDGITHIYQRYIYKAINTLGDSYMAREFPNKKEFNIPESSLMNPSLLDNGFDKVEEKFDEEGVKISSAEVEDETIVYYFNKEVKGKKKNAPATVSEKSSTFSEENNTPEDLPPIDRTPLTC